MTKGADAFHKIIEEGDKKCGFQITRGLLTAYKMHHSSNEVWQLSVGFGRSCSPSDPPTSCAYVLTYAKEAPNDVLLG